MNAHEVLVKARNLIDREGWVPYAATFGSGPKCAMGGLKVAAEKPGGSSYKRPWVDATRTFWDVIGTTDIACWNDTSGRTKEEVLAAFDEAIRRTAPPPADPLPRESYEGYCERTRREWDEPKAVPVP